MTYPEYNFIKHKGYSTEEHMNLINSTALPYHRKTFRKVKDVELPFTDNKL